MSHRKIVVHLIPTLERGGSEMSQLRMLPLVANTVESVFVTLREAGPLAENFRQAGIEVIAIHQKSLFDLGSYFRLKKTVQALKPDLVITHLFIADLVGRLFLQFFLSCQVVASLATTYNFPTYWSARLIERLTKYLAQGYIANAHIVKKTYVEKFGVPEQKITVLVTGMDTSLFRSLKPDQSLRDTLGIAPTDTVIVCVANLHINKGHRYLLEAFETLYQKRHDIKLLLVGDGMERNNLEQQVNPYDSKPAIQFLRKRSDVPQLLALSHIFVLPTFFEGMCNAIMEAMTSRLAVVTTDIVENRELITHEKTGLLTPVRDVPALVQALERLLEDMPFRTKLGENAFQSIEERYHLERTARRWEQFFLTHAKP